MKLKSTKNLKLWLPVSKTWARIYVEFFSTVVSVTIHRVGYALPSLLDIRIKNKDFCDDVMFYDTLLKQFDDGKSI